MHYFFLFYLLFWIKGYKNSSIAICYGLYFQDVIYLLTLGPKLRFKRHIKEQSSRVIGNTQGAAWGSGSFTFLQCAKCSATNKNTHSNYGRMHLDLDTEWSANHEVVNSLQDYRLCARDVTNSALCWEGQEWTEFPQIHPTCPPSNSPNQTELLGQHALLPLVRWPLTDS